MSPLIPSPASAPPSICHLPIPKRVELWYELIDEAEAMVKCGIRSRLESDGDLPRAYREWYARKMEQHDRAQIEMLQRLGSCEVTNGG